MPINGRAKGASGEREFCEWLFKNFNLLKKPERNLEQVRSGGADVLVSPFAFEVKRCEKIDKVQWWAQVGRAVKDPDGLAFGMIPVVAYRVNNGDWLFLISTRAIGIEDHGFVELTGRVFKKWAMRVVSQMKPEYRAELNFVTEGLEHVTIN